MARSGTKEVQAPAADRTPAHRTPSTGTITSLGRPLDLLAAPAPRRQPRHRGRHRRRGEAPRTPSSLSIATKPGSRPGRDPGPLRDRPGAKPGAERAPPSPRRPRRAVSSGSATSSKRSTGKTPPNTSTTPIPTPRSDSTLSPSASRSRSAPGTRPSWNRPWPVNRSTRIARAQDEDGA